MARRHHQREEGLEAVEHSPQVDGHHALPLADRQFPQGVADGAHHAGVVAQEVHGAEPANRRVPEGNDARRLRDVGGDGEDLGAALCQLARDRVHLRLIDVGQYQPGGSRRQLGGEGPADAVGGARDDGCLPGEVAHRRPSADAPVAVSHSR
jgi:hypothetical protein